MIDMNGEQFATDVLAKLPVELPISMDFEANYPQPNGRWWEKEKDKQKAHMIAYFKEGKNKQKEVGNIWGRLSCPTAMVWLLEALGESEENCHNSIETSVEFLRHKGTPASEKKYQAIKAAGKIREIVNIDSFLDLVEKWVSKNDGQ